MKTDRLSNAFYHKALRRCKGTWSEVIGIGKENIFSYFWAKFSLANQAPVALHQIYSPQALAQLSIMQTAMEELSCLVEWSNK